MISLIAAGFASWRGLQGASQRQAAQMQVVPVIPACPGTQPASSPPPPRPCARHRREDIQLALVETLAELNRLFAMRGILAGCTATLVLQASGRGGQTGRWAQLVFTHGSVVILASTVCCLF